MICHVIVPRLLLIHLVRLCWKFSGINIQTPVQILKRCFQSVISYLAPLVSADVTRAHICKVAKRIQESGDPGGTSASQWQNFIQLIG